VHIVYPEAVNLGSRVNHIARSDPLVAVGLLLHEFFDVIKAVQIDFESVLGVDFLVLSQHDSVVELANMRVHS
jgi:hypothetical protein